MKHLELQKYNMMLKYFINNMATLIKQCTCNNPFQDKRYGYRQRVHNIKDGTKNPIRATCTVCLTER